MVILSNSDYFQVSKATLIADYDKETLANFYQPLVGHQGFALYLSLCIEANNQIIMGMSIHENLFLNLRMAPGEFIKARKSLEAVGLIKTYLTSTEDTKIYHYVLYAPKTPKEFLEDTLLHGTLIKYAGESYVNRLKNIYHFELEENLGNDVSASFSDIFTPDFTDTAFAKALDTGKTISRNKRSINTEFNYDLFFKELEKISQINPSSINKKEMKEITRISSLYGLKEDVIASLVATQYNPSLEKGKRIDFKALTIACQEETNYAFLTSKKSFKESSNKLTSKSDLAGKINLMENTAPRDYLAILQNGSKPAVADLKIIDCLSSNFNLPNCVINAIVDFALAVNKNILVKAYCEKIAASVAREGLTTTYDTMNYLKFAFRKKKTSYSTKSKSLGEFKKVEKEDDNSNELEIDDIIAELDQGGDDDAKA